MARDVIGDRALAWARVVFGPEVTLKPDVVAWVITCARRHASDLVHLRGSVATSGPERRKWQNRVLRSEEGRVACVLRALAERKEMVTPDELLDMARGIRPWRDCGEPILAFPRVKPSGALRWMIMYGPKRLALSYLVADVLLATLGTNPYEFNQTGRGAEAAVGSLRHDFEHARTVAFTGDIKDYFPSIGHDGLASELQLSENVVRHAIIISKSVKIIVTGLPKGTSRSSVLKLIRRGLPQGSPASNVIASFLTKRVLDDVSADVPARVFTDNFFGACESVKDAVATLDTLTAGLAAHPLGPFELKDRRIVHSDQGVDLLGYYVKTHADAPVYKASVFASGNAIHKFQQRLRCDLFAVDVGDLDEQAINRSRRWVSSRSAWNPSARRADAFHRDSLKIAAQVRAIRLATGVHPDQKGISSSSAG
jgi:hypothetical protein